MSNFDSPMAPTRDRAGDVCLSTWRFYWTLTEEAIALA
jgi:hypothetical protein